MAAQGEVRFCSQTNKPNSLMVSLKQEDLTKISHNLHDETKMSWDQRDWLEINLGSTDTDQN